MLVKVTQRNIDEARLILKDAPDSNYPKSCPIALALKDMRVGFDRVEQDYLILRNGREIDLPPNAAYFTLFFDKGEDVQPFEFDISLV